jgi:hypothetical protein
MQQDIGTSSEAGEVAEIKEVKYLFSEGVASNLGT